jgi:hypothetical protein
VLARQAYVEARPGTDVGRPEIHELDQPVGLGLAARVDGRGGRHVYAGGRAALDAHIAHQVPDRQARIGLGLELPGTRRRRARAQGGEARRNQRERGGGAVNRVHRQAPSDVRNQLVSSR